jgi:methylenetetrahydrofolate dehydrogenase (NADP+)/methenyltetrahydrofolate cyclohydrolase
MILDGKKLAQDLKHQLRADVLELKKEGIFPGLAVVLVGDDAASKVYVSKKKKACEEVGIY